MGKDILDIQTWKAVHMGDQAKNMSERNSNDEKRGPVSGWYNHDKSLSPLSFYKYLKARFGKPNGFSMIFKSQSSDNLIHWHYYLGSGDSTLNILGKTSGIEMVIQLNDEDTITEEEWTALVVSIKSDYVNYGKQMKDVQKGFEHWSVFINPFNRIDHTLQEYFVGSPGTELEFAL